MPETETKLSSTLSKGDCITDERRLISVIKVGAYLSGYDELKREFDTIELSDLDYPKRWRKVVPSRAT